MLNNKVVDVIRERRSCRAFESTKIPEEIMNILLESACVAPSSGGFQQYSIVKVTSKNSLSKIAKLCRNQTFIEKAPLSLVFCIDFRRIKKIQEFEDFPHDDENSLKNFQMAILDTGLSAHNVCLAAESMGLASVYIGNILNDIGEITDILKLPKYVVPSIMLTIGYPMNKGKDPGHYNFDVIVHDEEYKDCNPQEQYEKYQYKYKNWGMKIPPYTYWFGHYYNKDSGSTEREYIEFLKKQGFFNFQK